MQKEKKGERMRGRDKEREKEAERVRGLEWKRERETDIEDVDK